MPAVLRIFSAGESVWSSTGSADGPLTQIVPNAPLPLEKVCDLPTSLSPNAFGARHQCRQDYDALALDPCRSQGGRGYEVMTVAMS